VRFDVIAEPSPLAAVAASRLSRKITGEVILGRPAPKRISEQKGVLAILRFSYHWVQGSPLPKEA
jgi:hypothetical protein